MTPILQVGTAITAGDTSTLRFLSTNNIHPKMIGA